MSYPGYGQWSGSYQAPSSHPESSSYSYNAPDSAATAANMAASQASFGMNAMQIPGLGITGQQVSLPSAGANGNGSVASSSRTWLPPFGGYNAFTQPRGLPDQVKQPAPQATGPKSQPPKSREAMEEGELTEEDFDDLYEPLDVEPALPKPSVILPNNTESTAVHIRDDTPPDEVDGQDELFYGSEPGEVTAEENKVVNTTARERSGSYSPHLSPREVDLEAATSRDASDAEIGRLPKSATRNGFTQPVAAKQAASVQAKALNSQLSGPKSSTSSRPQPSPASATFPAPRFNSAQDAKKEAKKAIVKLWPHVKFQTYIDEGFPEDIVRALFTELNLNMAADGKPSPPLPSQPPKTSSTTADSQGGAAAGSTPAASTKPEERKDRIARLLALKAAKTPATAVPSGSTPATATASAPASQSSKPTTAQAKASVAFASAPKSSGTMVPTAPAADRAGPPLSAPSAPAALRKQTNQSQQSRLKTQTQSPRQAQAQAIAQPPAQSADDKAKAKAKSDKELVLKQKLEKLLKSRAKSAASVMDQPKSSSDSSNVVPVSFSLPTASAEPLDGPNPSISATQESGAILLPGTSTISQPDVPSSPAANLLQPAAVSGRQSVLSTLQQLAPAATSRKRPVAADFVDYPSSAGPPKRPFGQGRHDSFVIDISDEESDEDVEMDVDSPGRVSSSQAGDGSFGRRGPAIRDFPPLSEGPSRRNNSGSATPAKLNHLNGEISSLQKRIAELEARKRKPDSAPQTPDVITVTPPEYTEAPKESGVSATISASTPRPTTSDIDAASAQLIAEAASAGLPKKPEPVLPSLRAQSPEGSSSPLRLPKRPATSAQPHVGSLVSHRDRIASIQLPKLEGNILEKKTKLKLLQSKIAQLMKDIELDTAEKDRLGEELRQLDTAGEVATTSQSPQPQSSAAEKRSEDPSTSSNGVASISPTPETAPGTKNIEHATQQETTPESAEEFAQTPDLLAGTVIANSGAELEQVDSEDGQDATMHEPSTSTSTDAESAQSTNAIITEDDSGLDVQPPPPAEDVVEAASAPAVVPNIIQTVTAAQDPDADVEMAMDDDDEVPVSSPESGEIDEDDSRSESRNGDPIPATEIPALASPSESLSLPSPTQPDDSTSSTPLPTMIPDDTHVDGKTSADAGQAPVNGEDFAIPRFEPLPSFTAYQSPLRSFASYRFHPRYAQEVAGGLRSLTYTNNINPKLALCRTELEGQDCLDKDCKFQHFATMVPKDDKILMDLGNADDFAEGPDRDGFIAGLRSVLADFRAQGIRDFDQICYGIINFRRRYIGDESRVLSHLGGAEV